MGDDITRSTQIIGWVTDARTLFSTSYDAQGGTSHFSCTLAERLKLKNHPLVISINAAIFQLFNYAAALDAFRSQAF